MNDEDPIYAFAKEHVIHAKGLLSLLMPQTSGIGIALKGLDGRYQIANRVMAAWFGNGAGQITGMHDADLFPAAAVARLRGSDQQIENGAPAASEEVELPANGVPGRYLWLKFPVLGPTGKMISIGSVVLDAARQESVEEMRQALGRLQQTNQELQASIAELDRLASTDKLTGAWNRRRLEEAAANEMERLRRYDHPLSLILLDIDFFKKVNDRHGHSVGDQVLADLVAVVKSTLRTTDSITRWGGEEFVVLCANTTLSTVTMLAERLREKIAGTAFQVVQHITVSMGVAECLAGETWGQWFDRTDAALYQAKTSGRNQVQVAPEAPQRLGMGESVAANFVQLIWHPAYESGHATIDSQHRELFGDANKLLAGILSRRPAEEISADADVLMRDIVKHFEDEEAIIAAAGFPGAAGHAKIHQKLVGTALELVARFHAGTLGTGELFQFLAHDMVARHMLGADREFFPYLQSRD
jgi:diguanylate cyclase (GGDEF)-like protein/hemerythrin-like metal-binding protein